MIVRSKNIYNGINSAPGLFPNPVITLAVFLAAINALDAAQQVVTSTRAKGSAATRDLKLEALWAMLQQIVKWIHALCAASPEQASLIIQTAGLQEAQQSAHVKELLALTWDPVANLLHAEANGKLLKQGRGTSRNTQFNWRATTDGKTYITQSTPVVRTVFTGLTAGAIVTVQVCITDSKGTTDWTPGLTITLR